MDKWERIERLEKFWGVSVLDMSKHGKVAIKSWDSYANAHDQYQEDLYQLMLVARTDVDRAMRWVGNIKYTLHRRGSLSEGQLLLSTRPDDADIEYIKADGGRNKWISSVHNQSTSKPKPEKSYRDYTREQSAKRKQKINVGNMIDDFNKHLSENNEQSN